MDLFQIPLWDHVVRSSRPIVGVDLRIVNFLSRSKFNGEGKAYALDDLLSFIHKCTSHKLSNDDIICNIFSLAFKGWI